MGNILVAAVVFGALGYSVFQLIRRKKKGGCAGGCASCDSCPGCSTNSHQ